MRWAGYLRKETVQLFRDYPALVLAVVAPATVVWVFSRLDLDPVDYPAGFRETSPVALVLCLSIWLASLATAAGALYRDRVTGTLERLRSTPYSAGLLVSSKTLVLGLLGVGQAVIVWVMARVLLAHDVAAADDLAAIAILALLAMVTIALGLFLAAALTSPTQIANLVTFLTLAVITLSGFFKPVDDLGSMTGVARVLPFTLGYDAVRRVVLGQEFPAQSALLLVVEAAALLTLSAAILRSSGPHPRPS